VNPSERELTLPDSRSESSDRLEYVDQPLRLVHHHPGYLRIQADAFVQPESDSPTLVAAKSAAEAVPGYRSWAHNPRTGSVVVEYDPGAVDADDVLGTISKGAGFRGIENSTTHKRNRQELVSAFLDTVQDVNHVVSQMTGKRADLRELVPVALAATSVVSFVLNDDRGRLPDWNNALYHSYRIFMHWHRREVRTRERVATQKEENGSAQ